MLYVYTYIGLGHGHSHQHTHLSGNMGNNPSQTSYHFQAEVTSHALQTVQELAAVKVITSTPTPTHIHTHPHNLSLSVCVSLSVYLSRLIAISNDDVS